jgi:hypothetical protein
MDMETRWSLRDLLDAHDILDLYERSEARAHAKERAALERARAGR